MSVEPYSDIEEARTASRGLREVLRMSSGGWRDEATLRRIHDLCWSAHQAIDNSYCREKIGTVEENAKLIFSDRRHRRWDTTAESGLARLRDQALEALDSFDNELDKIEAVRRAGGVDAYRRSIGLP